MIVQLVLLFMLEIEVLGLMIDESLVLLIFIGIVCVCVCITLKGF